MIEFGKTLREAREAGGYTISQIADKTRMMSSIVEGLEKEDFSRIAAPIYGRGFVKLYCEAVGLDPKPLVAEFMEIFNGNRDTGIKERPVAPSAAPKAPEPVAVAEPEPEPVTAEAGQPVAPEPEPDLFAPMPPAAAEPPPATARLSRYAAPVSQSLADEPAARFPSTAVWRIAALACMAIVILWLGILGMRALYHATSAPAAGDAPEANPQPPPVAEKAATEKAPRTPQAIPALYID